MLRQMSVLRLTAKQLNKDFEKASKEGYKLSLSWMKNRGYKDGSIWTYNQILKVFHK